MSVSTAAPSIARKGNTYRRYDPARIAARMTEEEYFAWEETQLERHDFREGKVITVAGGSPEHNSISTDTVVALTLALRNAGNACEVYNSDQKVCLRDQVYCYPDIAVVCGAARFSTNGLLLNPAFIIEVLSPSTEREDRTDKFRDYQQGIGLQCIAKVGCS
jgi:Uma2 family endonuclease